MVAAAEEKPPAPPAPRKEGVHKQTRELQVGFLYPLYHTPVCWHHRCRGDVSGIMGQ